MYVHTMHVSITSMYPLYQGIPVVDGQVLAMPVLDALLAGVVDVPVMIGMCMRACVRPFKSTPETQLH